MRGRTATTRSAPTTKCRRTRSRSRRSAVRAARQPAFTPQDHVMMAAIARESASVMHHLVVQHLQRNNELAQDKKSLYRPEALDSHRKKGQEGSITQLSPRWVKLAYPM